MSEATAVNSISVPTLPIQFPTPQVQVLVDQREGARFALAIANDTDQRVAYLVGGRELILDPHTHFAVFLDEWGTSDDFYGPVYVTGHFGSGPANVIGLRYTGEAFTTIPATIP